MPNINTKAGTQEVTYDSQEAGEGLAIFFSQQPSDVGRFRFLVSARLDEGIIQVGEFYSSPPSASPAGPPSRMLAGAICPGARTWVVDITCIGAPTIPDENPGIILASSKCCSAPVGLSRVNERYNYAANTGTNNFTVLPGMKVTGIGAIALGGGGSFIIGAGNTVSIPAGAGANLAPEGLIPPNTVIAFTNCDWVVEYLESA